MTGTVSVDSPNGSSNASATIDRQWQITRASATVGESSVTIDVADKSVAATTPAGTATLKIKESERLRAARAAFDAEAARAVESVATATTQQVRQVAEDVARAQSQAKSEAFDAASKAAPASAQSTVGETTVTASYEANPAADQTTGA